MLGLGRAIGETIAVVLVIGNAPEIPQHLFTQGYTLAAVIANEFGEAANTPIHSSALFAGGLGAVRADADRQPHAPAGSSSARRRAQALRLRQPAQRRRRSGAGGEAA